MKPKLFENRILAGFGILFIFSVIIGLVLAGDVIINAPAGEINATTINAPTGRTATYVVCANNSVNKAQCDYICDGVDDQVEIQQAIDALPSNGGIVKLLEGKFNIGSVINITKDNVMLFGCSGGTWEADGTTIFNLVANSDMINITGQQVDYLRDIQIIGIKFFNENRAYNGKAISAQYVVGLRISDCGFNRITQEAILIEDVYSAYILGCNFQHNGNDTENYSTIRFQASYDKNTNPKIDKCVFEVSYYRDIEADPNTENLVVTNSFFEAGTVDSTKKPIKGHIYILGPYPYIAYNFFYDCGDAPHIQTSYGAIVSNNVITNPSSGGGKEGIYLAGQNSQAINNIVKYTNYQGIRGGAYYQIIKGNIVSDCTIFTDTAGVTVESYAIVEENLVFNNRFCGISVTNRKNVIVTNNIIGDLNSGTDRKQKYGIYGGGTADNITVIGNHFFNNINGAIGNSLGTNSLIKNNFGYITENSGNVSKANGDTISHSLDCTPTYISVTPSNADHIASVTAKDSSTFTLGLKDYNGTAITTPEEIYWYAEC